MLDRHSSDADVVRGNLHSNLLEGVLWIPVVENELNESCDEGNGAGLQSNNNEAVNNTFGHFECGLKLRLKELEGNLINANTSKERRLTFQTCHSCNDNKVADESSRKPQLILPW